MSAADCYACRRCGADKPPNSGSIRMSSPTTAVGETSVGSNTLAVGDLPLTTTSAGRSDEPPTVLMDVGGFSTSRSLGWPAFETNPR